MNTRIISKTDSDIEQVDITPDISLMPKLAFAGYSAPQAIGELVDNAIDARLDGQLLTVSINITKDSITVADNGSGMDKNGIRNAFVLALSDKKGKLGEFGLGLKTASLSLGRYFEVHTTARGEAELHHIALDLDEWLANTRQWRLPLKTEPANSDDHFTVVTIKNPKVFYPNLPNNIRTDLGKRYAPFITAGQVEIKVRGIYCRPDYLVLIEGSKKEFNITLRSGCSICGWYGLLREGSQKGYYGFSTFRRGRMITTYDKIGFDPHPTVARLVGELHMMDHVPVTHNKREFEKESYEYKEAEAALRSELKEILRQARTKANQDTVTPMVRQEVDIWKEKIAESLKSDEFKNYTSRFKGMEPMPNQNSLEMEEPDIEKRGKKEIEGQKPHVGTKKGSRTPIETHRRQRHVIRVKGKAIEFTHAFVPLGSSQSWKTYSYYPDKSILEIFTNTDFPAYSVTKDKAFYAVIHIAEAISEIMVHITEEDPANEDELKQLILRKASELKCQV